jgi:hypothetical protein
MRRKACFFEKKEQEAFTYWPGWLPLARVQMSKSFWLLFCKKEVLA